MGSKRNSNFSPTALKRSQLNDKKNAYTEKAGKYGGGAINWQSLSAPVMSKPIEGPDGIKRVIMRQYGKSAEPMAHSSKYQPYAKTVKKLEDVPVLDDNGEPMLDEKGVALTEKVVNPNKLMSTLSYEQKPIYENIGVETEFIVDPETGALVPTYEIEEPERDADGSIMYDENGNQLKRKRVLGEQPRVLRFKTSGIPKSYVVNAIDENGQVSPAHPLTTLKYLMEDWAEKVRDAEEYIPLDQMPLTTDRTTHKGRRPGLGDLNDGYDEWINEYDDQHQNAGSFIKNKKDLHAEGPKMSEVHNSRKANEASVAAANARDKAKSEAKKAGTYQPAHGQAKKYDYNPESPKAKKTIIIHRKGKPEETKTVSDERIKDVQGCCEVLSDARFKDVKGHFNNLVNHYNKKRSWSNVVSAFSRKY